MATQAISKSYIVSDPPAVADLLGNTRWSFLWLVIRIYLGYQWFIHGVEKMKNPAWAQTGEALKGFWANAVKIPETGRPPVSFDWYRSFLQVLLDSGSYTWFAKVVVAGEVLIGLALILGLFTGIAAFLGGFMNWNFMMAGAASVNPVFFVLSIVLLMAWKTAGWLGVDRWLLPLLGVPWKPGLLFKKDSESPAI